MKTQTFTLRIFSNENAEALEEQIQQALQKAGIENVRLFHSHERDEAAVARLTAIAHGLGKEASDLDDLTHEAGSESAAAQANNDGIEAQIQFLLDAGWSEEDIHGRLYNG